MANRVTDTEVKEIIATSLTTTPFIDTANALINETLLDQGFSEAYLTQIEKYLSAHFVSLRERQLKGEKLGDASNTYGGEFGKGLRFSQYGQQVLILDTSGTLEDLGKAKAEIDVITI